MNAVEIEEAVSRLVEQPFDAENFPFLFLEAFGNKATTIQRLRTGASNKSDVEGGVLQHNNIHIAVSQVGDVTNTLTKLRESSATTKQKAKFILATDGKEFQAEDLSSDIAPIVCEYNKFPDHFGFFLPLAGISTVKQIRESSFDIKATGRLNRLYVELLKDNPTWGSVERRHDMNHFMARLIFCFFAEDTNIFNQVGLFSKTIEQMTEKDSSNTHEVMEQIFRAMNTDYSERKKLKFPRWVEDFPYVNGGLFSGDTRVPRFSKIARSYLLHIGNLEWKKINPDIFGSMIQAVAEDEERGALGMHYTSVPNILRVLNPLFLDDLREQLEKAGDNARMLLNLRKRISKIRVFDPACGSGNFLVIAYKEMRAIEAEINRRRNEVGEPTEIELTNFRGIELRDFPAEVARLALVIAEYQCNVIYLGQMQALADFLPLESENWIVSDNALKVDWTKVCPVPLTGEEYETYICGNPPYRGSREQNEEQKNDLRLALSAHTSSWASLDYVAGWFVKASEYMKVTGASFSFVSTNSISQGQQVPILWPIILSEDVKINFAYTSFHWSNLASHNAGVTVVIVGVTKLKKGQATIFTTSDDNEEVVAKNVENINAYLVPAPNIYVQKRTSPISESLLGMDRGSAPVDGNNFTDDANLFSTKYPQYQHFVKTAVGGEEFVKGITRKIIHIDRSVVLSLDERRALSDTLDKVQQFRLASKKEATRKAAKAPEFFVEDRPSFGRKIFVPQVLSENREYITAGFLNEQSLVLAPHFYAENGSLDNFAILNSKMHMVWVATICGKLKTDFRYSSTLGWNTFPVPLLTDSNKVDLSRCAEEILLARESHFPLTIGELYNPQKMPENLRLAHSRLDETLERIYIGRRFKNDTERLEKLFDLYTKIASISPAKEKTKAKKKNKETMNE